MSIFATQNNFKLQNSRYCCCQNFHGCNIWHSQYFFQILSFKNQVFCQNFLVAIFATQNNFKFQNSRYCCCQNFHGCNIWHHSLSLFRFSSLLMHFPLLQSTLNLPPLKIWHSKFHQIFSWTLKARGLTQARQSFFIASGTFYMVTILTLLVISCVLIISGKRANY